MPKPNIKTTAKGCLTLTAAFILIWIGAIYAIRTTNYLLWKSGYTRTQMKSADGIPGQFPVLVITKDPQGRYKAIITPGDFALLLCLSKQDGNYTYLVPKGMDAQLNRQLRKRNGKSYPGSFTVKRLANGTQYIKVMMNWYEGRNYSYGWYIAQDKKITPKYVSWTSYGGISDVFIATYTFLPSLGIWTAVIIIRNIKRKRRSTLKKETNP